MCRSVHSPTPHFSGRQPPPQAFTAGNLPLAPRIPNSPPVRPVRNTTPYVRPTESHAAGSAGSSASQDTVIELFRKIVDEIRCGREEYRKMSEDIKGIRQAVNKLEANYRKLWEDWKEQNEASFTIESSPYKV